MGEMFRSHSAHNRGCFGFVSLNFTTKFCEQHTSCTCHRVSTQFSFDKFACDFAADTGPVIPLAMRVLATAHQDGEELNFPTDTLSVFVRGSSRLEDKSSALAWSSIVYLFTCVLQCKMSSCYILV